MAALQRFLAGTLAVAYVLTAISCGGDPPSAGSTSSGGGTTTADSNVASVIVDSGPSPNLAAVNTLYTTVTICVPGSTTQCQTIDHIQVDTGSSGFRVLASVLALALPLTPAADGNALVECTQFVDGYSWGPVASADLQVAGESAASIPIQVIGDAAFSSVPAACSSTGPTAEDTVDTFGANGILGIGFFAEDCGDGCSNNPANGFYYSCSSASCAAAVASQQVANPVPLFKTDNNGSIIDLPAVAAGGATTVTGSLIFGIDTQSNNASGTQTVLTVDPVSGYFTTVFGGESLTDSFIDSGTNGIYFNDSNITQCTSDVGFYCPATPLDFSATLVGTNSVSATATFTVDNAETGSNSDLSLAAIPTLAGAYAVDPDGFDWGLPFFYGRRVATAVEGHRTAVATGPYVAF